jgi:signal transduction histidine kinase
LKVTRYLRDAALFVPCYVAIDWLSYFEPLGSFNITPWNPQPALAIVWMMLAGLNPLPVVFLAIAAADVIVRHAPGGLALTMSTSLVLAVGYAAIARALKLLLRDPALHDTRDLTMLMAVVITGSAIVATAFTGVLRGSGALETAPFLEACARFWLGDAVGVMVTMPLLLAVADAERRRALRALAARTEPWLQLLALLAVLWLSLEGLGADPTRHFYLLFVPIIWIAMRSGMNGAAVAAGVVQILVVLAMNRASGFDLAVFEMQIRVCLLALTGLFLGMAVDERSRAEDALRQSLRLAAAGEMAGAIAHEVNQPLTAVSNYARSARVLVKRTPPPTEQLEQIVSKMLFEADRAADVVRRVRDFFRTGTTRLEPLAVTEVLALAERLGESTIAGRPITLETRAEPELPSLLVDRLQVELILRNLLVNAVESLGSGARHGRIRVAAERHDGNSVRIVVADDGPGIPEGVGERLFQPFVSGKPTGMGLGLAVSRAMAEAHGGSLSAASLEHGEFHLVLPCAASA